MLETRFKRFYKHYIHKKTEIVVFISYSLLMLAFLLYHNFQILIHPFYEGGDAAANSILISQAKNFSLLVGHYSRFQFNHPGPAILYLQAFSEIILHDWLGLVPTPFNAHLIAILILNSLMTGIVMYILYSHFQSLRATIPIFALMLGFIGYNSIVNSLWRADVIASTWIPDVMFMLFFAFIVSAASVASNKVNHISLMVFTGSLLAHAYVILPLFVVSIGFVSILLLFYRNGYKVVPFIRTNSEQLTISLLIISIFALPIVINTIVNYPGEVGKYIGYAMNKENTVNATPSLGQGLSYYAHLWASNSIHCALILLFILAAAYYIRKTETNGKINIFFSNLYTIFVVTTAIDILYIFFILDDLKSYHAGFFYIAIPFTCTIIIGYAIFKFIAEKKIAGVVSIIAILSIAYIGFSADLTCNEPSDYYIPLIVNELSSKPELNDKTIVLDFELDTWPKAMGIVVALDRENIPVVVPKPYWAFLFTNKFVIPPEQINENYYSLWVNSSASIGENVIFSTPEISLMEV